MLAPALRSKSTRRTLDVATGSGQSAASSGSFFGSMLSWLRGALGGAVPPEKPTAEARDVRSEGRHVGWATATLVDAPRLGKRKAPLESTQQLAGVGDQEADHAAPKSAKKRAGKKAQSRGKRR